LDWLSGSAVCFLDELLPLLDCCKNTQIIRESQIFLLLLQENSENEYSGTTKTIRKATTGVGLGKGYREVIHEDDNP
jgi:hypothetical protein